MEHSFLKRVAMAQNELKAPKSQYNNFGKYNYRNCEDILESAKPLMVKYNLLLTISDSVEMIGERYYIKAEAFIWDTESDRWISNSAYARESIDKKGMDDSQITGTASSYARKYALNGILCIDDTKDADTDEYKNQTTQKADPKKQKVEPTQKKPDGIICERCGKPLTAVTGKDGNIIPPETVKAISINRFGMTFCASCQKAESKR